MKARQGETWDRAGNREPWRRPFRGILPSRQGVSHVKVSAFIRYSRYGARPVAAPVAGRKPGPAMECPRARPTITGQPSDKGFRLKVFEFYFKKESTKERNKPIPYSIFQAPFDCESIDNRLTIDRQSKKIKNPVSQDMSLIPFLISTYLNRLF
jgi:hypothetical protein